MSEAGRVRLRDWEAETAIVLGSGLNSLVENVADERRISYAEFPELPRPTVAGHAGEFVLAEMNRKRVLCACGRAHLYEGHAAKAITANIRLFADCGIKRVILTNAAGSANAKFAPGSWMMICDHLNLTGATPLLGAPQFIDMTDLYSAVAREHFSKAAEALGFDLHEGVYAGMLGPQYETPAEVRMLQSLGADAIGMSTVLEAIQARALGLEVVGFSCLTNWAAGITDAHLSHQDVLAVGKSAAVDFARLLSTAL